MTNDDINLDNLPCRTCPDYQTRACTLRCPKLVEYGYKTEAPLSYPSQVLPLKDELSLTRDIHGAREQEEGKFDALTSKRGESHGQDTRDEEDSQNKRDQNTVPSFSIVVEKGLDALIRESKIIKSHEVTLREQFFSFMGCMKITEIATLAGDSVQNLHIKIARRIKRLAKYIFKHKDIMSKIKRENVTITLGDVSTPLKFKTLFNIES